MSVTAATTAIHFFACIPDFSLETGSPSAVNRRNCHSFMRITAADRQAEFESRTKPGNGSSTRHHIAISSWPSLYEATDGELEDRTLLDRRLIDRETQNDLERAEGREPQ